MEIGFVGAGRMGAPMAANLAMAGWSVTVHDPGAPDLAEVRDAGANPPSAPVSVIDKDLTLALDAGGRSTIFLPGAAAVRQVLVAATALGLRDEDMSRVIDVVRQLSGPPARPHPGGEP